MNRDTLEKWVLLDQSRELDAVRRLLLRRALGRDEALRAFAADARGLAHLASRHPAPGPGAGVIATILAAGRQAAADHPARAPEWTWRPALAVAGAVAALALVVYAALPQFRPAHPGAAAPGTATSVLAWDDNLDAAFDSLQGIAALKDTAWNGPDDETEKIARELLDLEGETI
jgi:hypothetical protein